MSGDAVSDNDKLQVAWKAELTELVHKTVRC